MEFLVLGDYEVVAPMGGGPNPWPSDSGNDSGCAWLGGCGPQSFCMPPCCRTLCRDVRLFGCNDVGCPRGIC